MRVLIHAFMCVGVDVHMQMRVLLCYSCALPRVLRSLSSTVPVMNNIMYTWKAVCASAGIYILDFSNKQSCWAALIKTLFMTLCVCVHVYICTYE